MPAVPVAQVYLTALPGLAATNPAMAQQRRPNPIFNSNQEAHKMKTILRTITLLGVAVLLMGCPQTKEDKDLSETLKQYETIVRWAQWDAAANFISPEYQKDHPISRLEMDRLRLFRVTQYILRSSAPIDNGDGLIQVVELHIFNKNQARERTIIDEQYWKYDQQRERWLLHSGLPDPTQKSY